MKIRFIAFVFLSFYTLAVFTQNVETDNSTRRITLNTNEVYYGEIIVENEQIVMIRTADGSRYQFPTSEIKSIEKDFIVERKNKAEQRIASTAAGNDERFVMLIEFQGGISYAKQAYSHAPTVQTALVLGAKDVFFQNTFLGGGIGYNILFPTDYSDKGTIDFLPFFVRIQTLIGRRRLAPYIEMDAGYSISLNPDFAGGAMLKLSAGLTQKINSRTVFYFGIFVGLQNFSGKLTQTNDFGTFNYYGNTTMQNFGAKIALKF